MLAKIIQQAGSPQMSYQWAKKLQPWFGCLAVLLFAFGVFEALVVAPADYQQGNAFRIMYLHVPAALGSLAIYISMSTAAIIYSVWRIKVADAYAKISAPIGAAFTFICLLTGSIWGKPTWGTFWIWDARLTSELILLFIYIGIIALRNAIPEPTLAARASGLLTLVGLVNIPIIHYSVQWWNTLHQGASLSLTHVRIAPSMLLPLIVMLLAFLFFYAWLVCLLLRGEILQRELQTHWVKQIAQG